MKVQLVFTTCESNGKEGPEETVFIDTEKDRYYDGASKLIEIQQAFFDRLAINRKKGIGFKVVSCTQVV